MTGDLSAGTLVGSYRIESLVGRGGMGVVYRAQHTRLKRLAALKVLAPEWANDRGFHERFQRESELAAAIDHPNIIPVYDAGEADGFLYIAMRFVDGTDLRELLDREGPLTAARALDLLEKVAAGLDAAHRRGLVHRDVKPGNIMIADPGDAEAEQVFLTDFGLVKHVGAPASVTRTGYFVGTVDYAAPEQFRGETLDGRADQYALGCVLYQCLTGRPPFARDDDAATMFAHLSERPPPLGDSAEQLAALDPVLERAMAKSRDHRFPTCTAFVQSARGTLTEAAAPASEPFTAHTRIAPPPMPARPAEEPLVTPDAARQLVPPFAQPPGTDPTRPVSPALPPKQQLPRRRWKLPVAAVAIVLLAATVGVIVLVGGHKGNPNGGPTSSLQVAVNSKFLASPGFHPRGTTPNIDPTARISGFLFRHSLTYQPTPQSNSSGAPNIATYDLPAKFARFASQAGWVPDTDNDPSLCPNVEFKVLTRDGAGLQPRFDESVVPGIGDHISFALGDVTSVSLETIFPRGGDCAGTAVWGNPTLIGSGQAPSDAGHPDPSPSPTRFLSRFPPERARFVAAPPTPTTDSLTYQPTPQSNFSGAPDVASYDLGGGYKTFSATLRWESSDLSTCPTVEFQVFTDGTEQFHVPVPRDRPVSKSLSMKNVGELELATIFPRGADCAGTAVWESAKVVGPG